MHTLDYLRHAEEFIHSLDDDDSYYWFCGYFSRFRTLYPVSDSVDKALWEMGLYTSFQGYLENLKTVDPGTKE